LRRGGYFAIIRRQSVIDERFRRFSMSIGVWQVVLILVIVLIIFGAGKLPRVMGDVAKGVRNFKKGMNDELSDDGTAEAEPAKSDRVETAPDPAVVKEDETAKS
jgi:sec-independent protein translocase protein TatA